MNILIHINHQIHSLEEGVAFERFQKEECIHSMIFEQLKESIDNLLPFCYFLFTMLRAIDIATRCNCEHKENYIPEATFLKYQIFDLKKSLLVDKQAALQNGTS